MKPYPVILIGDLLLETGNQPSAEMVTGQVWLVYKESRLSPLPSASCPTPGGDRSYAKADSSFSQPSWGVTLPSKSKITMLSEHNHHPSRHQQIPALSTGPAPHWLVPRLSEECVTGVPNHCQSLRRGPERSEIWHKFSKLTTKQENSLIRNKAEYIDFS